MKLIQFVQVFALLTVVLCESSHAKRGIIFRNWPVKPGVHSSSKQVARGHAANVKQQKTLVVQIRSDQPVPLVLKGRPSHGAQHVHPGAAHIHRGRPIKLTAPVYLKTVQGHASQMLRKPLKIKLTNSKLQHKPAATYEKPFKYEQPAISYSQVQKLPFETYTNFHNDHFTPIHTIPAPNLALQDNHLSEGNYLPPKPQPYHQSSKPHYQVLEETNDETIVDASSGSQKLFAPDPDPSLPAIPIRLATESFNQPSIGKPLPVDVQTNYLLPAQPLVQIVGAQQISHSIPEIYPVEPQLQSLVSVPTASLPLYNPTYLVSQSNNLYNQHQQQLFQPAANIIEANYANADLTQEVASNGQILQAVKDHSAHPVFDAAPQFAALIAAPSLSNQQQDLRTAPFHLPNVAAASPAPEIFSPYYGQAQDSSQLLQAYAEDEALIAQQQQQQHDQLLQQQQHDQLLQQQQQQEQEQQLLQQQQNHLLELQRQQQLDQTRIPLQQDPSSSAFEEHQRLVQQQLGNVPLRIFVPDDDSSDGPRLQKRADNLNKGTVEYAKSGRASDLFEVSSSVEVSNDNDKDELALAKINRN